MRRREREARTALTREVYLDWNATAPPLPEALEAMRCAAAEAWANPASVHGAGRRARALLEDLREALAGSLGFEARQVVFTSGGTEANNLALHAATALVTSRLEHPSVTRVAEALATRGVPVEWLPVTSDGRVEPDALEVALQRLPRGAVAAVMAVNHETGVIQPISAVAERVHALGATLHVDAVQALGKLPQAAWSGADSVAVAAHKLGGPKGIGAIAWRAGAGLSPLLLGGSQERGVRPGTQDAVLAAGWLAALRHAEQGPQRYARLAVLRDRLERTLSGCGVVNGAGAPRVAHVTNQSFSAARGDEIVAALDLLGIRASSGSACTAGTAEASPVIGAMLGRARALGAVRLSLGETTTEADIAAAEAALLAVIERASTQP